MLKKKALAYKGLIPTSISKYGGGPGYRTLVDIFLAREDRSPLLPPNFNNMAYPERFELPLAVLETVVLPLTLRG